MTRFTMKYWKLLAASALSLFVLPAVTFAQYKRTDLVTNATDSDLVNAWGLTRSASGSPFWVSDNVTGKSTLYNGAGQKFPLPPKSPTVVTIPPAPGTTVPGSPTGDVFNITIGNPMASFPVSNGVTSGTAIFLFDTLDGTISGWNPGVDPTHALIAVDRSSFGAVYTGLAITSDSSGDFLYAADNGPNSRIDVFDRDFKWVRSFTDPAIHGGFAPYGIQNIGGKLWVTFGGNKSAAGFVDEFDTAGNVLLRITGPLHSPWGLAMAPADFGPFSNTLLIANNVPDGRINAFDPTSGAFLGTLRDANGQAIVINQVWAIQFGNGGNGGQPNQLFFTAGPNNYADGLFGMITVAP
ncbi:MAG TPA: TIGR03118 family protein [Candidatus Acidoferrum sp.]|nr:TIGR03118 family protein [Candidatus Acidoferrum sp.]